MKYLKDPYFIFEKPRLGRFPIEIRFFLQKRGWYVFPQGVTHQHTIRMPYRDIRKVILHKYTFFWLFLRIDFTVKGIEKPLKS